MFKCKIALLIIFGGVMLAALFYKRYEISPDIPDCLPDYIPQGYALIENFRGRYSDSQIMILNFQKIAQNGFASYFNISIIRYPLSSRWLRHYPSPNPPAIEIAVRGHSGIWIGQVRIGVNQNMDHSLEIHPVNILFWDESGLSFAIQSNSLDRVEMLHIADSLEVINHTKGIAHGSIFERIIDDLVRSF
jgi:hypothetical protein